MARFRAEDRLQQAICQHLNWRGAKGLVYFSVPNGCYRTPLEAQILKATGTRAGVADLILMHAGTCYALELKTPKGRTRPSQIKFMADWIAAGGVGAVCRGIDEALAFLEQHGLLRKNVARNRLSVMELPPDGYVGVGV